LRNVCNGICFTFAHDPKVATIAIFTCRRKVSHNHRLLTSASASASATGREIVIAVVNYHYFIFIWA
jgi:hypothetical protein